MTSGILLLDKPSGLSSNAALQRVRRLLGADKAGHVGSLDPLATGMLPICVGEATKVAGEIVSGRKLYRFSVGLGLRTETGDLEGPIVERAPVPDLDRAAVDSVLRGFTGRISQTPPMYSALKHEGRRLYELARAGLEVVRLPREIEIHELRLHELRLIEPGASSIELEVLCSKGTYVRTLAEDIARALGTCGHVTALRRVHVEPFVGFPMCTIDSIEADCAAGRAVPLLPPDSALQHLPAVPICDSDAKRIRQGQSIQIADRPASGRVRLYDASNIFIGLGESDGAGRLRPKRLLLES